MRRKPLSRPRQGAPNGSLACAVRAFDLVHRALTKNYPSRTGSCHHSYRKRRMTL